MAKGMRPSTVAPTVIITGRNRTMPASSRASRKGSPRLVRFFDEVEQNDDVTDDHADKACDSQESHESEGLTHDDETRESPCHSIRDCSEDEKRLDGTSELHNQRNVDQQHGDRHDHAKFLETFLLFVVLASDLEEIAGRQVLLELLDFRQQRREHLRR